MVLQLNEGLLVVIAIVFVDEMERESEVMIGLFDSNRVLIHFGIG